MGPPGGGRNDISSRMTRHTNIMTLDEFDDMTLIRIFSVICDSHFSKGFEPAIFPVSKVGHCRTVLAQPGVVENTDPLTDYTTRCCR